MNNNVKRTIVGTAAAGVLATGVYMASSIQDKVGDAGIVTQQNQGYEFVDNVVAIPVEIPKVIPIPVEIPKVIPIPVEKNTIDIACVSPAKISRKTVRIASVYVFSSPMVNIPCLYGAKKICKNDVCKYGLDFEIKSNPVRINDFSVLPASIVRETVVKLSDRIPEVKIFLNHCAVLFQDQRNLQYDKTVCLDSRSFEAWLKLYQYSFKYDMQYIDIRKEHIKMIAEIHHPINLDILDRNLCFYQKRGFNSVLVTFGYKGEDINQLVEAINIAKKRSFKVYFAYAGPEKLSHSVFQHPEELKDKLQSLSLLCDGFFIGWRRTSLHLFEQDKVFSDYMAYCVRTVNPAIPIVGEIYYGQTASSNGNANNLQYNIPANCSGALITGLGYNRVAVDLVCKNLFADTGDLCKFVLIVGDRPYYATRYKNTKTFLQNFAIKEEIKKRWQKNGVCKFVFLHGDGSDGAYSQNQTDNLGSMEVDMK